MSGNESTRMSSLQLARPQGSGSVGSRQSTRGYAGSPEGFEVAFVDGVAGELRRPLADVAMVAFELVGPVRTFPSYKGQRNYPGFYWAACSGRHVGFESWLERDEAMALDFDADVVGFAAQPFWLFWPDTSRMRSHAPDFFARTATGRGVVIDCRPAARIKPRDAAAFEATARACAEVGWDYRLVSEHDAVWLANVKWLAGYRHPRHFIAAPAAHLREVFERPLPLVQGASLVGDPIAVLPVVYHLLWAHRLHVDLSLRLDGTALVTAGSGL